MTAGYPGPFNLGAFLIILVIVIILVVVQSIRSSKKENKVSSASSSYSASGAYLGDNKQLENEDRETRTPDFVTKETRPKFGALYGRKAMIGVIVDPSIVTGDILFYSIIIPAATISAEIATIAILIAGVVIAAFSNLSGLIRVANARKSEDRPRRE
jgi:hypothetical protein